MPIYDYRCTLCSHEIEVIHGIDAPGPTECDVCGGPMRKALSAPAIHFKGSGWAKKDAQSAAKKSTTAAKSKGASADGSANGAADGDSKPGTDAADKKDAKAVTSSSTSDSSGDSGTTASTTD